MAKLKVFRTPAGFHDAYVAAPSQKAALAAWGSDADLFARGIAEVVTDPALTKAPLEKPGAVIRVARTGDDTTIAAPRSAPKKAASAASRPAPKRPSRRALDAAEQAVTDNEARYATERAAFKREEEAIAKRRRAMETAHAAKRVRLDKVRIKTRDAYEAAIAAWRDT